MGFVEEIEGGSLAIEPVGTDSEEGMEMGLDRLVKARKILAPESHWVA